MATISKADQPPLRAAQIIETLTMGGAENLAIRIANALAEAGHDSHLIVMTERDILSEKVIPDVKVHYLGFWRASIRYPIAFLSSLGQGQRLLADLLRRERIQVVQTHLPGSNFWGLLLELRDICPVVATVHNNEEFNYGEIDNRLVRHFRKRAYQMILRRCHGTVAVSDDVADSLARELGIAPSSAERIRVVTNGVQPFPPLDVASRLEARFKLGIPPEVPMVLGAGRLSEQKNFKDLVTAIGILRDRKLKFQAVIAGEGDLRDELSTQIERLGLAEILSLPGNLTNLGQVMGAGDIFVLPSLWEGLPLVLLEAMSHGLAVVANDIKGMDKVLIDRENGLVVPVGDSRKLADSLEALITNEGLRRTIGDKGRALVTDRYNFQTLVDQLVDLYRSAVV
ncbi:MAG: glycosyltransferase [Gemmatimonadales bacterium]|nr:glycosyltransferase [Gemmatimonadales bacterium]